MLRTFSEHAVRPTESLNGWWEFITESERKDRRRKLPKDYTREIHVPCAWETLPGLESYRGKAWFRTDVPSLPGLATRIVFGGVSHTADLYVDGKHVAHHYDAFTPWDAVVPNSRNEGHELVVEVDNSFGEHSALHINNDYYTYGGITRPVAIEFVPEVYIDRMFATPKRTGKTWSLDVRVRLKNWSSKALKRHLDMELACREFDLGDVTVKPGAAREVHAVIEDLDVNPWRTDAPALYMLHALLSDADGLVDDLIERIGFRDIAVRGKKLLLNGESIRLRGYNRHEDHPQFGCALPLEAMLTDLQIMQDLGCNFVRTSHYPNDRRFLDLCDEMGFAVWEESHARNVDFKHPKFREQIADSTTEMIDWHHNHPCILMWGCLNECNSVTKAGRREHKRVIDLIRRLDPSRPITFASNKGERDICLDLVDIVSQNRYVGWYHDTPADVADRYKELLKWIHSDTSGAKGKPVIMSEFGAGAMYGWRNPHEAHWTEEYQRDVLDETLRVYLNDPSTVGATIWQFCDVRVTPGGERVWWRTRPRSMNNKGTVDEYRRPKLCYDVVKQRMHEAKARWDN